ncbi:glycerophosphodiester phosphodiesterase family protein [Pseudarthrobacter sp. PvP090]|uniref:glycerophosphodiester phosphodiesterase n=1 Tax=Pseudarthrobacter sp. PvP090 TaxID=3156393 RepID=UPI003399E10B
MTDPPKQVSRRNFLALASVGSLLSACTPGTGTTTAPQSIFTISDLLSSVPFYISHRGSGDNWPEHTLVAYEKSRALGVGALEISVHATKDNVFVCHHDSNTERLTGVNREIREMTLDEIGQLRNDARQWLGPSSEGQPVPRLADALEQFAPNSVIFLEDKSAIHTQQLLDLMDSFPDSTKHFVWKQQATSDRYKEAAARGYKTWGYFSPDDFGSFASRAALFDYVGIFHSATDEQFRELASYGKPVVCWEVHTRRQRDRLLDLGVTIMMCSNAPYVMTDKAAATADQFAGGLRANGDLPWTTDRGWAAQPAILPASRSLRLEGGDNPAYRMGSMCPIGGNAYKLSFEMRWPDALPDESQHAGVALAMDTDEPYRVLRSSGSAGYHVILRRSGDMELFVREANAVTGNQLARVRTPAPRSGTWMSFELEVTPERLKLTRVDGDPRTLTSDNRAHRGGYFSLNKNYGEGPAVEFRSISVVSQS